MNLLEVSGGVAELNPMALLIGRPGTIAPEPVTSFAKGIGAALIMLWKQTFACLRLLRGLAQPFPQRTNCFLVTVGDFGNRLKWALSSVLGIEH